MLSISPYFGQGRLRHQEHKKDGSQATLPPFSIFLALDY
jgi:hypothetical protein